MIVRVTYENLDKYGRAFYAQFCLRNRCFIERQNYNVLQYKGMEFDQYDTPAAVYLVALSPDGEAWGCSRLTPVSLGSMLKDLWPHLVDRPADVFRPGVWEGTRFCVDKTLAVEVRQRVCRELVVGYFEAGLAAGMQKIIGVMPPFILRSVFRRAGCTYQLLGPKARIESGDIVAAASMDITAEALLRVRATTGLADRVTAGDEIDAPIRRKAA